MKWKRRRERRLEWKWDEHTWFLLIYLKEFSMLCVFRFKFLQSILQSLSARPNCTPHHEAILVTESIQSYDKFDDAGIA